MSFNIEILEEKKNLLIDRTEVKFKVEYLGKGTPNRLDVKKKLAALKSFDEKLTMIIKLRTYFGQSYAIGKAQIYDNIEELQRFVPFHIQVRNIPKEKRADIIKLKKQKQPYAQLFEYQ